MAKADKFNLADLLSKRSMEVKEQTEETTGNNVAVDTEEDCILDIYDLIPSKENFYDTETDLEELKQSIELVGLLQPILVKPDGEKYKITAGHRRRLALLKLVEEGKDRFRKVHCIKRKSQNEILDQLALIMANRYRTKTEWERMTEAIKTEELVLQLKEEMNIPGRTRDLLAEIIKSTPAQVGRYKAIYNNLVPDLMEAFKDNCIGVSAIYEASGMGEEWQQIAFEKFIENGELSISEVKKLKKREEAAKQIPGQLDIKEYNNQEEELEVEAEQAEQKKEYKTRQCDHMPGGVCNYEARQEVAMSIGFNCTGSCCKACEHKRECGAACNASHEDKKEEFYPQPEEVVSKCYSCLHYSECGNKKSTVTSCDEYINKAEAEKTEEQRYSEEQNAIDRETARKLKEQQQEEKMQQLPSDSAEENKHEIRLAASKCEDIESGKQSFLLVKKDKYNEGEEVTMNVFHDGRYTGRNIVARIKYIMSDYTGLDENYCILGIEVVDMGQ